MLWNNILSSIFVAVTKEIGHPLPSKESPVSINQKKRKNRNLPKMETRTVAIGLLNVQYFNLIDTYPFIHPYYHFTSIELC